MTSDDNGYIKYSGYRHSCEHEGVAGGPVVVLVLRGHATHRGNPLKKRGFALEANLGRRQRLKPVFSHTKITNGVVVGSN